MLQAHPVTAKPPVFASSKSIGPTRVQHKRGFSFESSDPCSIYFPPLVARDGFRFDQSLAPPSPGDPAHRRSQIVMASDLVTYVSKLLPSANL
uniref:Uncharacterized protein n=1 Tax=Hyaloperonospora arabidopsidis (strain Emoy2) TaxID=559515 RepID=M4B9A2_HYAAE